MIEAIKAADRDLFLFLNGLHHPALDVVMYHLTREVYWIPLYLFLLWAVYRAYGLKFMGYTLLGVVVVIAVGDRVSVELFKNYFQRYRPSHNLDLAGMVHTVNGYRGGQFGFVSSHSTNSTGIATFLYLVLRPAYPRAAVWIFAWAAFFSYTRIYLGVHYPADVVCGAILGGGIGYGVFVIFNKLFLRQKI